jgi:diaminopimelate epimerase
MQIQFTKMQGAGNDMIMIDNRQNQIILTPEQVANLCNRQFGIGADGLILLETHPEADCFMNYYNADGTTGEMCGNGIRCTAKFFQMLTDFEEDTLKIHTRAGTKPIQITTTGFIVNMGQPQFEHQDFPNSATDLEGFTWNFASMGNPHAVTFVEQDPYQISIETIGPKVERNTEKFPKKINVEFVKIENPNYAIMRVWERGSGVTLACGSGACAVFAVGQKLQLLNSPATINLPGGNLIISYNQANEILMEGPAETVFTGTISI